MAAKFYVYRNLNRGGFSIKHAGRVVARPNEFTLQSPKLQVSEKSQTRARQTKQRNVHAYVVADGWEAKVPSKSWVEKLGKIYYNPFTCNSFVDYDTKQPINKVKAVYFIGDVAYYLR